MENQHRKIKGYRELNEEEIYAINRIKEIGNELGEYICQLECLENVDNRWVSIGRTHLQQGMMALVRSVAKPESF